MGEPSVISMFLSLNDVKVAIPKELAASGNSTNWPQRPSQDDQTHPQMRLMIL
jgi:hypothetical protein